MDYIIEFLAEFIGNITGKCEPEKIPDDLDFKESFVVKPYPKNIILCCLCVITCFVIVPFAYIGNGVTFAGIFGVCGIILLILGMYLNVRKYEIDDQKNRLYQLFFQKESNRLGFHLLRQTFREYK